MAENRERAHLQECCVPATLAARPAPPSVFALRENLVLGSLRDDVPLAPCPSHRRRRASRQSRRRHRAHHLRSHRRSSRASIRSARCRLPPTSGDQFRFRAVVNGDTPPTTLPPDVTRATTTARFARCRSGSMTCHYARQPIPRTRLVAVYDDDTGLGQPRDWFFCGGASPSTDLTLYSTWRSRTPSTTRCSNRRLCRKRSTCTQANRAEMYLFLELGINYGVVRDANDELLGESRRRHRRLPPSSSATLPDPNLGAPLQRRRKCRTRAIAPTSGASMPHSGSTRSATSRRWSSRSRDRPASTASPCAARRRARQDPPFGLPT